MKHSRSTPTVRSRQAGFTLTELMVAITGGLLLAIAVFALARDSTRFYRREARIGDATLGAVVAFQRLQADIQRAGFMASPNILQDTRLCSPPAGDWPERLKELGALRITNTTAILPGVFSDARNQTTGPNGNGALEPDVLTIAGSFAATDEFPIWGVTKPATNFRVSLQDRIGPLLRMGFHATGAGDAGGLGDADRNTIIQDLFRPGQALRIVDRANMHYYGKIVASGYTEEDGAFIDLDAAVNLQMRTAGSTLCGLGATTLGTVNAVNFVRYELRPGTAVSGAGGAGSGTPGSELDLFEQTRTDLIRTELDVDGNPIPGTTEIAAEYAVDLRFGVLVDVAGDATSLTLLDELDPVTRGAYTGNPTLTDGGNPADIGRPDQIVSVRARLSVRSQMPDRSWGIPAGGDVSPGFYRMYLGETPVPGGGTPRERWARVRTLQADITLRNVGN